MIETQATQRWAWKSKTCGMVVILFFFFSAGGVGSVVSWLWGWIYGGVRMMMMIYGEEKEKWEKREKKEDKEEREGR